MSNTTDWKFSHSPRVVDLFRWIEKVSVRGACAVVAISPAVERAAKEVAAELNAEDIVCDFRPGAGVRFSPHFYTTDEELDRAFEVVDDILRTGRWHRQDSRQNIVT